MPIRTPFLTRLTQFRFRIASLAPLPNDPPQSHLCLTALALTRWSSLLSQSFVRGPEVPLIRHSSPLMNNAWITSGRNLVK